MSVVDAVDVVDAAEAVDVVVPRVQRLLQVNVHYFSKIPL